MARTPKPKKGAKGREISIHSRAARRGTDSDALPLKSKSHVEETEYKPWLHNAQNSGISKKKKSKPLSRQQKLRQQKGHEHAERNLDKLEKKVADSKKRAGKVQARRVDWEELNGVTVAKQAEVAKDGGKNEDVREREMQDAGQDEWEDVEEEEEGEEKKELTLKAGDLAEKMAEVEAVAVVEELGDFSLGSEDVEKKVDPTPERETKAAVEDVDEVL